MKSRIRFRALFLTNHCMLTFLSLLAFRFKTFIQSNDPKELLSESEYVELAKKINEKKKKKNRKKDDDDSDKEDDDEEEKEEDETDSDVIAPEDKAKAQNKIIEKHVSSVPRAG